MKGVKNKGISFVIFFVFCYVFFSIISTPIDLKILMHH